MKYTYIERHEHEHGVRRMCSCLQVHPCGYYAWKADPMSSRAHSAGSVGGAVARFTELAHDTSLRPVHSDL